MSAFNTANELASQLVWGKHYCDNCPCEPLNEIILYPGDERRVIRAPRDTSHQMWAAIATELESLLGEGWL